MFSRKLVLGSGILVVLLGLGALLNAAEEDVIYRGSDLWETVPEGTYVTFSDNPIPAGFFCSGSAAFAGRIELRGEPLQTDPPGVFGRADTILERLDDAVFDERGLARTRLQMRALSLVSLQPIRTQCGSFLVTVGLDGEQPVTEMRIARDGLIGGYFMARVELNALISFWPMTGGSDFRVALPEADKSVERGYRPLQIVQFFRLNADPSAGWTFFPGRSGLRHEESVRVDMNGDGNCLFRAIAD